MSVTARLDSLGISLPQVATPAGSYLPATVVGDLVYTSGQLPMVDGELLATGLVGASVTPQQASDCARVCALNCLAAAAGVVGGVDNLAGIVKVSVFVASDPAFTGQPGVANGASDLLEQVFGEAGRHVRAAVGVAVLPLGAPVEVELIARVSTR